MVCSPERLHTVVKTALPKIYMLNDFDDCFDNYYLCGDSQQGQWIEMNIGRPLIAPVVSVGHLLVTLDNVYRWPVDVNGKKNKSWMDLQTGLDL